MTTAAVFLRGALLLLAAATSEPEGRAARVYATPLYGGINDYAYYFVDVLVGSPARRQSVILDSGSSLLGFPCTTCGKRCGRHIDEPFDVAQSATSELYSCHSPKCISSSDSCLNGGGAAATCRYSQVYSEGSSIEGYFFSDNISLAPVSVEAGVNPRVRYDYIGCHQKETVLFTSQQASGILGVSFPRGGKQPTVMDALSAHGVFSICASEDGGILLINGSDNSLNTKSFSRPGSTSSARPPPTLVTVAAPNAAATTATHLTQTNANPAAPSFNIMSGFGNLAGLGKYSNTGPRWLRGWKGAPIKLTDESDEIIWTKIVQSNGYSIKVVGLSARNSDDNEYVKLVDRGFGEVLVDSGTTYTYLPNDVYQRLSDFLIDRCQQNNLKPDSQRAGSCLRSKQDLICYDFSNTRLPLETLMSRIPSLSLELGDGAVVEWKPQAYLFRKTTNVWCTAIENNRRAQTILGMSFLKQKQVIFDRENSRIGFVSAKCPSYKTRQIIETSDMLKDVPELPRIDSSIGNLSNAAFADIETSHQPNLPLPTIADYAVLWSFGAFAGIGLMALATVKLKRVSARTTYAAL